VQNDLNDLKTVILIVSLSELSVTKKFQQLWKKTNCGKMERSRENNGKCFNLYCINFFIMIKIMQKNRQELLQQLNNLL